MGGGEDSDEDTEAPRSNKHLLVNAAFQASRTYPPSVITGYKVVGAIYNRGIEGTVPTQVTCPEIN